jgi:hypothetical protein
MKSLVSYLNQKSANELRFIAETWQANLTDRLFTGNTFQLAQEMQNEFLERRYVDSLTPFQAAWLTFFLEQPDYTITYDELVRQQPEAADRELMLKTFKAAGVLIEEKTLVNDQSKPGQTGPASTRPRSGWSEIYGGHNRDKVARSFKTILTNLIVPRELARPLARLLAEKKADLEPGNGLPALKKTRIPLKSLLFPLEIERLEQSAETWNLGGLLGNVTPAQLVAELVQALTDRTQQDRVLADLGETSQELFKLLKLKGGRTTLTALLDDYVSLKRLGRSLRPLLDVQLVWEAFEGGENLVFIPEEIQQPRQTVAVAPTEVLQTVNPPGRPTLFPPYALAWDMLTFLNYIKTNDLKLTNHSLIPKRDLKKISAQLWPLSGEDTSEPENQRLDFLVQKCSSLSLYATESLTWRLQPGAEFEGWLELDFYGQMRKVVNNWLNNPGWGGPVAFPYYYGNFKTITQAYRTMLDWLKDCEPGAWYSLDDLIQKVQRENPYFILPRRDLLQMIGLKRLTEMSKQWLQIEGAIIQKTFQTFLEWLGIVQIGRSEAGRAVAFSLTDFGAEICGRAEPGSTELPRTPYPLLVQPNFEIMLFAPEVETLWTLEKFTDLKKLDQVSLYTLTKDSVLRGLEAGLTPAQIQDWLQKQNPQPLPQNLAVSLQDWSKGFKRVQIAEVTLLEVEDPAVLDELINSKQFADSVERRISPTAALVRLPEVSENRRNNPLKTYKTRLKNGGFFAD